MPKKMGKNETKMKAFKGVRRSYFLGVKGVRRGDGDKVTKDKT